MKEACLRGEILAQPVHLGPEDVPAAGGDQPVHGGQLWLRVGGGGERRYGLNFRGGLLAGGSGGGLGGQERIGDRAELGDLPGRVGAQRGQVSGPPGHPLALLAERIGGYRTGAERIGVQRGAEPGEFGADAGDVRADGVVAGRVQAGQRGGDGVEAGGLVGPAPFGGVDDIMDEGEIVLHPGPGGGERHQVPPGVDQAAACGSGKLDRRGGEQRVQLGQFPVAEMPKQPSSSSSLTWIVSRLAVASAVASMACFLLNVVIGT
jgi:hypothetical protein